MMLNLHHSIIIWALVNSLQEWKHMQMQYKQFCMKISSVLLVGNHKIFGRKCILSFRKHTSHFLFMCIAYLLLTAFEPSNSFWIINFVEGLIYYAIAMGAFTNDYLWFLKSSISSLLPDSLNEIFYDQLRINLPMPGSLLYFLLLLPLPDLL